MEDGMRIHGSLFFAGLHLFIAILVYFFCIVAALFYLEAFHDINMFRLFLSVAPWVFSVPWMTDFLVFIEALVEDIIIVSIITSALYAASLSNNRVDYEDDKFTWRNGILFIKKREFEIDDIEQVYTKDYPFFRNVKKLCIMTFNNEVIYMDYVRGADAIKKEILKEVKSHHVQSELHDMVQSPVKVVT